MDGHLALVLQGGGAGPHTAPLLIPSLALGQSGARVEVVPYPDFRPEGEELTDAAEFNSLVKDRLQEILESGVWSRVTFIAKSRGTLFLAGTQLSVECEEVDAIWVTPLLALAYVREGVVARGWRSLIVAGGADEYHDQTAHEEVVRAIDAASLVIERADHALVIEGDVAATLEGWRALSDASLELAKPATILRQTR